MAGEMVTVACKLPHGLILDLRDEQGHVIVRDGHPQRRTVKGFAVGREPGTIPEHAIIGGFGLTTIEKDFWDAWLAQNKDLEPVVKGYIFARPRQEEVRGMAKERGELKSGLEAIDPEKPGQGIEKLTVAEAA